MLENKVERALFICILVICFFVAGFFGTKFKLLNLPINKGLSAEQIIEDEFKDVISNDKNYRYLIRENFLFTAIKRETGYWQFEIAVRNENSGFIFDAPGISIGPSSIYKSKSLPDISLGTGNSIGATILKFKTSYAVIIGKWQGLKGIKVYANGKELESLTGDPVYNDYWFYVTDDLSEEIDLHCVFNQKEYHFANNEEIKALFKEEHQ